MMKEKISKKTERYSSCEVQATTCCYCETLIFNDSLHQVFELIEGWLDDNDGLYDDNNDDDDDDDDDDNDVTKVERNKHDTSL